MLIARLQRSFLLVVLLAFPAGPVWGGDDEAKRDEHARTERILRGLHQGIESLEALGGHPRTLANLKEIAAGLRHRLEDTQAAARKKQDRGRSERQVAEQQLELLLFGHRVLVEAKGGDCSGVLEHAAHALKLRLKGRRDDEAREVYETAPKGSLVARCLRHAAEILADKGEKKQAGWLEALATTWNREHGRKAEREDDPKRMGRHVEIMGLAKRALTEADKERLVGLIELAMHWRELWLEGDRGEKMERIRREAPKGASLAELLMYAAKLWRGFENAERAGALEELAQHFLQEARKRERAEAREPRNREQDLREIYERLEDLHRRLEELHERIRAIR